MADLAVTYMGLPLSSPLIVSSCSLTNSVDKIRRCQEAGAGAVVLKSLFEEQIDVETSELEEKAWPFSHPEAFEYLRQVGMNIGQDEYLKLIEEAKRAVSIPVIASLNCVSPKRWVSYARRIAAAGADALELNIAVQPRDPEVSSEAIERHVQRIVDSLLPGYPIPVAVKIGAYFTSLPRLATALVRSGARALVLFNRFYQVDFDIEKLDLHSTIHFSSPGEMHLPLRWIALLHGRVNCDLAASTGVHDADGVIKQLLAGAAAVQVCSTLYLNGLERLNQLKSGLAEWMDRHGFASVADFRGRLSRGEVEQPEAFDRLQYIKALVGVE